MATTRLLFVVCVNWGRGYSAPEIKANINRVAERFEDRKWVTMLIQELDEDDKANEHQILERELEKGSHKVAWRTHEPIVLSPPFRVSRPRIKTTMNSGVEIGAPVGTGPRRYAVTCIGSMAKSGLNVGFGNTHPHRNMANRRVQLARAKGERIFRGQLVDLYNAGGGTSVIWGADTNDLRFPEMIPEEKTAIKRGLDVIRYKVHPKGAKLKVRDKGTLNGTIDGHDPIWASFEVTTRGR